MSYQSSYSAQEQAERDYIRECGETGTGTIIDTWLNHWTFLDRERRMELWGKLTDVLTKNLSALEIAQGASVSVGGPDFETWQEENER
jgi:hypothetical protein